MMLEYYSEGKVWDRSTGFVYPAKQDNKPAEQVTEQDTAQDHHDDDTPKRRGRPRKAD